MASHTFYIDGYLGDYGYSKQFVRSQLNGHKKDAVTVKISSLGGSVDHAISIFDQFKEHGNVTAELSAFVASSATLLSLGAKKVRMNENSFYLIHKPMNWVDEWNTMNEDDIEALIEKFEKQKKELAKITLQMAKMYVRKTGKTLEEIINLMKENTWLNADEALEWGFIDEVFEPEQIINYLENQQMVAMIISNGMPAPPRKITQKKSNSTIDEESLFDRIWNKIKDQLKKTDKPETDNSKDNPLKDENMNKRFLNVNQVLGVETLESTEEGVFLNEEQLQNIEDKLLTIAQAIADRDEAINERDAVALERDNAINERDNASTELTNTVGLFDAIDPTVANAKTPEGKAEAIRALLAAKPGSKIEGNHDTHDPEGEKPKDADWDIINSLPHNKSVDQNS